MTDALLAGVDKLVALLEDVSASQGAAIEEELFCLMALENAPPVPGKKSSKAATAAKTEKAASGTKKKNSSAKKPKKAAARAATEGEDESADDGDAQNQVSDTDPADGGESEPLEIAAERGAEGNKGSPAKDEAADEAVVSSKVSSEPALQRPNGKSQPSGPSKNVEKGPDAAETIRVSVDLLNNLMNLAGELVLGRNQIKQALNITLSDADASDTTLQRHEDELSRSQQVILGALANAANGPNSASVVDDALLNVVEQEFKNIRSAFLNALSFRLIDTPGLSAVMQNVDLITGELQSNIMNTRMQPVGNVFSRFPRLVRDLAKKLSKEIDLSLLGEDV